MYKNSFKGLDIDEEEISNEKKKRKLNKKLREIQRLELKEILSPEEQIKVDKEEEIKEKLRQFDENIKIPKRKSTRHTPKGLIPLDETEYNRKKREKREAEFDEERRITEAKELIDNQMSNKEKLPPDIYNFMYINKTRAIKLKLLKKYHPDKASSDKETLFTEYTKHINSITI